jgi:signal transduction histidine kinase
MADISSEADGHAADGDLEFRYRNMFQAMAVAFWDLDFTGVGNLLRKGKASGVTDLRRYLTDNPALIREAMKATIALDLNEKSVQLFRGKSREALLGPIDVYWPRESEWVYVESVIAAVSRKPYFQAECKMLAADGSAFDALFTVSFPTGAVGRGQILVGIVDMTERNRALDALQRTQAELAHAARVATLGELTASIAHEVNQPLSAIVTNGEAGLRWLARATPDLGEVRSAIRRMVEDGKRAAGIIARIRAMATKAAPERVRLALNDLVSDSAALLARELAAHGIPLTLDLAADLPAVSADKVQIQQVLVNLIVNAMQAMAQQSGAKTIAVRTRAADGGCAVEVEDSGPGIPAAAAARVFDAFYSTKPAGMGMGLSICRSVVEAHGGRIALAAKSGAGALFRFTLPATAA